MAEFLVEKDQRTNDDIRRRAAEEPELRAKCDRQESALEGRCLGRTDGKLKLNLELNEANI